MFKKIFFLLMFALSKVLKDVVISVYWFKTFLNKTKHVKLISWLDYQDF